MILQTLKYKRKISCSEQLHISGAGVARGYLNRPELTKDKFIKHPFNPDCLMYKTGDLARWLPEGNIEFLGRNDNQVKVRGYRIELGEIESILNEFSEIQQAIVIESRKNENKFIAAYIVPSVQIETKLVKNDVVCSFKSEGVFSAKIRERLKSILPDYMLPDCFTLLDAIPLTKNGKLDKQSLPEPIFNSFELYVAPKTPLEIKLVNIWQDILQIKKVGVEDNFFLLGGNSITLILLLETMNKELQTDLTVNNFLNECTIALICQKIHTFEH